MATTSPTVSVIVPVFASERYVAETIRSVLAQTMDDFEIVIVDDGSPDRSIAICQRIVDPRIRYVRQANAGLAAARNAGIRDSRGKYVAFLDSDDLWEPEKLARHVAHLEARPELGVSYGFSAFIDEAGVRLGCYQMLGRPTTRASDCFIHNPIGNGSNAVVRASVFRGEPRSAATRAPTECLFDEELRQAEDYEFWTRIATLSGWAIGCIPWPLTLYRIHTSGLSADVARQRRYHMRAIEKVAAYAPGLVTRHRAAAESTLHWYLARNLVLQKRAADARLEVGRALRRSPANLHVYYALLVASLALMRVLPRTTHERWARAAIRVYGRCQRWFIRRRQRASNHAAAR